MRNLKLTVTLEPLPGRLLPPGSVFPVPSEGIADAEDLVARGFAVWADEAAGTVAIEQIIAAIGKLEPGNESHFTADGKPALKPLAELLGAPVTAKQRDEAWAALQA